MTGETRVCWSSYCIEKYVVVVKVDDVSNGDSNDGKDDENLEVELLVVFKALELAMKNTFVFYRLLFFNFLLYVLLEIFLLKFRVKEFWHEEILAQI